MTGDKLRRGLVGVIDLEAYDYTRGTTAPIRASENTIVSRLPPRVKVRRSAPLELPHVMVLIGKGEGQTGQGFDQKPNWQENIKMAQAITDCLNDQVKGLCRDVRVKNGRFNQHISTGCVLIEAGNNRNTLEQVLAAMPYLADAIAQSLEKVSLEK